VNFLLAYKIITLLMLPAWKMHFNASAVLEITSAKCYLIKSFIITHFHKACI